MPLIILLLPLLLSQASAKFRSLSCPNICNKDAEPVCGDDGRIYKNDCSMRKENCGDDISTADWNNCRLEQGSKCLHSCDQEVDMVCGTDGRTYINPCFLRVENCLRGVDTAHFGQCSNRTNQECPGTCVGAARDGPVCGSDGNVYANTCEMKKTTCGQNVVVADNRHCKTTKPCEERCFKISKVSCGSDGKMYNNGCQMKRKNCGKHIYEVPIGFCLNRLYRTQCPIDCSAQKDKPVCGSDGQLYSSECELEKANCGFPLTTFKKITKVPLKECSEKIETCARMNCPEKQEPVCGNDGVTYRSLCELQEATCRAGVQLSHPGPCLDLSIPEPCPQTCPETNSSQVVCGSNGNVYRSQCELEKQTCGERVRFVALHLCQTTRFCEADCSGERNEYVCGSDGNLHRNTCSMRKTNCGENVYSVPVSECLSVFQWKGCARVCPPTLDPVCGTDGKTYLSRCFMQQETCRARSLGGGVQIDYYGRCGEPRSQPKFLPYFQHRQQ